ncbi:efflux RND transporter permease subunit [Jingyaoa shaoxingensis]|uniref:MMPL family transporter n=1 Tax=Jingyaoa shaoxingensis TaxID=2763671 RepID=A0ABR7NAX1_9FIRM|nr:MMPL family transporter [Jingyaoa shaoxingensis]MBC8573559.1 MMPL family transporter [Jingyaoa shaoxingensis]
MKKIGKAIAKGRYLIFILALALLVPSAIGYLNTRVNYDILSYLPESLETVSGQDIMVDEFGMGAFSMVIVEGMDNKDAAALETDLETVNHVKEVLWYDDMLDLSVPVSMIPDSIRDAFFQGDATMMIALFDNTTSADETMEAITDMRKMVGKDCFISGMSGVVTDIKNLALQEMPVYVVIASLLSLLVLLLTTDSFVLPFIFLSSIGFAVVYNMGTNIFLGQISYITQALVAVLQLGVTMDYSIFLLHSYEEAKPNYENRNDAMAEAIANTFISVAGSSVTTVAGFAALIFMTFELGRDLGIVMIKGVVIGVICCVTVLPSMILIFEKAIDKTRHKPLLPSMDKISDFIIKHSWIWLILFVVAFVPALNGNNGVELYYNIDSGLPDTLDSAIANKKLSDEFHMSNVHLIMVDSSLDAKSKKEILNKVEDVDGVKWALGLNSVTGEMIPDSMMPKKLTSKLKSDNYEIMFVCSDYSAATDEVNAQIASINDIVKSYDPTGMVIGEAPLMKDLEDTTSVDLVTVNTVSILAIFVIVMIVFKSISLPAILVTVIEFAIFVNMAFSYYRGISQPFVAPIVVGTIQLGATVDYAILMTNRYKTERMAGREKHEAISIAHKTSFKSILTSGLSLFAATIGVALYSNIDMIRSIVILLCRGAIISMIIVLVLLPAMLTLFDKLICYTTIGMRGCAKKQK